MGKAFGAIHADAEENDQSDYRRYWLLAFLVVLNTLNFIDRQLIASFANFIVPDLGLSNTQYGLLTGFVFLVFYSTMGLFMGFLADNVSRTRLIAAALALWSMLTALSGMAKGFVSLAIPRALIGVGESALAPAALSLLADKFPSSKLSFACSLYYLGIPLGAGLSFIIAGQLGPVIGWRGCFYILGGIGLVAAMLMLFVKDTHRQPIRQNAYPQDQKLSFGHTARVLISEFKRSAPLRYLIAGSLFINLLFGAGNFDQLWLVQERGFERAAIANLTGWIFVVAGIAGSLLGAYGVDYCKSRFNLPRIKSLFWVSLIIVPVGFIYRLSAPDTVGFWLGFVAGLFYLGFYVGPFFSVVQELTPANVRGTMIAFSMLLSNIVGLGFGNLLCGVMIDWLANYGIAQPYTLSLITITGLANIGLIFFYLAGRERKNAVEDKTSGRSSLTLNTQYLKR